MQGEDGGEGGAGAAWCQYPCPASSSSDHGGGSPSICEAGSDRRLHHLLLVAVRLRVRTALAGPAVPPQTLQLPDCVPLPVPPVGRSASAPLLLLLQRLRSRQRPPSLHLLAALLLPRLPAVLHTEPHEPLLCTGERWFWSRCGWSWNSSDGTGEGSSSCSFMEQLHLRLEQVLVVMVSWARVIWWGCVRNL